MTSAPATPPLPWHQRWSYGLPAFSLAVVGIPVYVHIPKFYTDVVGIDIAWVGSILMLARLFDAFSDPLMGVVSDRTHTRMGRRRPFIIWGSVCLAAAILLLFSPPHLSGMPALVWFAGSIFGLFFCWTVVTVPYEALGPALTSDYAERTSLFAVRDGLLIAGTLLAAASPALIDTFQGDAVAASPAGQRQKFLWIALIYAPLLIATCWWCVWRVHEPAATSRQAPINRQQLKGVLRNRPFRILLTAYTIGAFGSNLPATLILYYVQYVIESTHADLFLLIYFASGILVLPLWIRVSRRVGKKNAWLASMAINTCAFTGVYFLGPGDEWGYGVLVAVSGLGFGATLALPSAIQADVIDYDEYLTGSRQEGWYIGIWSVVKKFAAAVGVGAGLTILGAVGYVAGERQPPEVIQALKILYALVPSACNAVAFAVALAFPISPQVHQRILESIASMKEGRTVSDPLRQQ